jgi:predicted small metal-binding protein
MAKIVECQCGYVARGETDDELVRDVQEHAKQKHQIEFSREQVMAMAKEE